MSRIKHDSYKHPDGTQEIENKETNQTQNKICAHFKPLHADEKEHSQDEIQRLWWMPPYFCVVPAHQYCKVYNQNSFLSKTANPYMYVA